MAHLPMEGLKLTEEEAYSLLALALTSPQGLDAVSERALRKLAEYCTTNSHHRDIKKEGSTTTIHLSVS